jgi:hypothetical protein
MHRLPTAATPDRRSVMSEERARILQMISQGKITAEEGVRLLNALREASPAPSSPAAGAARWFRVRVTDMATGRVKVNVNLPLSLVKAGMKMGARFSPEMDELNWKELAAAIQEGASGKIVDVEDQDDGEKVEVYVE